MKIEKHMYRAFTLREGGRTVVYHKNCKKIKMGRESMFYCLCYFIV
jgi:phage gp45-like